MKHESRETLSFQQDQPVMKNCTHSRTSNKYSINKKKRSSGVLCGSINTGHSLDSAAFGSRKTTAKRNHEYFLLVHMHVCPVWISYFEDNSGGRIFLFYFYYFVLSSFELGLNAVCSSVGSSESKLWWRIWFCDICFLVLRGRR